MVKMKVSYGMSDKFGPRVFCTTTQSHFVYKYIAVRQKQYVTGNFSKEKGSENL